MFSHDRAIQFEFLDNTADIQVHSCISHSCILIVGGHTLEEAIEQCVLGMYGYILNCAIYIQLYHRAELCKN